MASFVMAAKPSVTKKRHAPIDPQHIQDLHPDPANRRAHNPRNLGMISDALHAVGAARSIVIDEDNVILAGNGVTEAAADAGITKLRVIEADGQELIAVRRRGLTPDQKRALALYDNRTGELASWNIEQLQADVAAGLSLAPWWTDDEVAELLAQSNGRHRTDADDVPPVRPTDIRRGDLFALGPHRLLCGDATDRSDVQRLVSDSALALVLTDPPYNVGKAYGDAVDDAKPDLEYCTWNQAWFGNIRALVPCVVLTPGITNIALWLGRIEATHKVIAWVKENQCSRQYIGKSPGFNTWEPVLVYGRGSKCVARDSFSIPISIQPEAEGHPCPKSVKAWSWLLENFSDEHEYILDPFSGSGTTVIACEQMERRCWAMEIEPQFVQLAIDRWEAFAGQKATKVGEAVRA